MMPLSLLTCRTVSILELKTIVYCINKALHAVKPVHIGHPKIDKIKILMINGSLMKVKVSQNAPLGIFCNTLDLH